MGSACPRGAGIAGLLSSWHDIDMSFSRLVPAVVATLAVVGSGCAARFEGELDGEPVPTFSTAAYFALDGAGASTVIRGLALPGDSCVEGATLLQLEVDRLEATSAERLREVNADLAAFHARVLPRGAWVATLQIATDGKNLLSDLSVDLDDADTDADVGLTLCQSDDDADPTDTDFVPDLDCSLATDGVVDLTLDDGAGTLGVDAREPLTFSDTAGRGDGTLRAELDFVACPAFEAPLVALATLDAGTPEPGPVTDPTTGCETSCFIDPDGKELCEVRCP